MPFRANQTLLEQMRISEWEVARRKELLGLTDDDAELLKSHKPLIETHVDAIVQDFYTKQLAIAEIALLIGDADTLSRLQHAMRAYILALFGGYYDSEYVNGRLRIGMVHKRIGVDPKLYLCAVRNLKDILFLTLTETIVEKEQLKATLSALDKLIYFDVTLIFDTYIRSLLTEIETAHANLESYAASLEKKIYERTKRLEELTRTDALTGLYNRRAFDEALRRTLKHGERNKLPLSLIYFDIDDFKRINDEQGHQAGDKVLAVVGRLLKSVSRESEIACRLGGDEFSIVLINATVEQAQIYCKRLLQAFHNEYKSLSLSIGIVQAGPDEFVEADVLVKMGDQAMYRAKQEHGTAIVNFEVGKELQN